MFLEGVAGAVGTPNLEANEARRSILFTNQWGKMTVIGVFDMRKERVL